jgi:4-hydroxybenzoate polyprenyltransferase
MNSTIKKLFWTSRPVSWINTAFPFSAAYLVTGGGVDAVFVIGSLFFLIPYNLLMYGINDVFDYESDKNNPRKNSIEGGLTEPAFHKTIINWSLGLAAPFTAYLLLKSPDMASAVIFAVSIFFVLAYSVPGLRFKEKPFLDSFTSAMHFVLPMVYGLSLTGWQDGYFLLTLSFVAWAMASHAFGAVQDIIPDRQANIASIGTVMGARQTVRLSFVLYVISAMLLIPFWPNALAVSLVGLIYAANIFGFLRITDKQSPKTNKAWRRFIYLNQLAGAVVTITLILI